MARTVELTLDNFSDDDVAVMRDFLTCAFEAIPWGSTFESTRTVHQGSCTIHIRPDGPKPGVEIMDQVSLIYERAPKMLIHVLRKLFNDNTGTDR